MGVTLAGPKTSDPLSDIRGYREKAAQAERVLGKALLEAHSAGLHRAAGHDDFYAFVRAETGVGRRRADRLMRDAEASARLLSTFGLD